MPNHALPLAEKLNENQSRAHKVKEAIHVLERKELFSIFVVRRWVKVCA
jgi:hypothetical protein